MILYNVTVGVDEDVEEEWLTYMKNEHIPAVLNTGMFQSYKIYKVLSQEEESTISYSVQYFARDIKDVVNYLDHFAPELVSDHMKRFENKHVAFRTLLEEVV